VPFGPGRASLLTGLYQFNHRAVQNTIPLDARHLTLPKALRRLGYDPALIGYTTTTPDPRTTTADDPRFRVLGDHMEGFRAIGAFEPDKEAYFGWVAAKGYALPENRADIWLPEGDESLPGPTSRPSRIPAGLSDTSFFTERALAYLRGRNGKPWFLHLGYFRPHPPFAAPAPYHDLYAPEDVPAPRRASSPEEEARQHPLLAHYLKEIDRKDFFQGARGRAADLSEREIRQLRASYFGLMSEIDDCLGRVFALLEETGQWDDTLIVFTCDHGEQLGDHHLLGKIAYFDESYRIPLIVRDPTPEADGSRGRIVDEFTETIDTMPTILEWLGGEIPRSCDGSSVLRFVRGGTPSDWRTEVHYEFDFRDIFYSQPETALGLHMDDCSLAVIQDMRYKYVYFSALPPLLFDLTNDPGQFVNRAGDPAMAPVVRDYSQKMLTWRMRFAERALTHYRATPQGLDIRQW